MDPIRRTMKRYETPGHARYLTFSCYRRLVLFGNDRIKDAFAERLAYVIDDLDVTLFAWVIMPEHVHLLVLPDPPRVTVKALTHRLKSRFAQEVIGRWRQLDAAILPKLTTPQGTFRFWQDGGGYDRNLVTPKHITQKIDYIHNNPVARNLVKKPTDWKWSSARHYARETDDGPRVVAPG
jgi:putative transposase